MDFTFLFIVILMLLAVKSGLEWVAAGLAILLFVTSKGKYLWIAAGVGIALVVAVYYFGQGEWSFWIIAGGLGLGLLLLAKKDSDEPQGYSPPMGM